MSEVTALCIDCAKRLADYWYTSCYMLFQLSLEFPFIYSQHLYSVILFLVKIGIDMIGTEIAAVRMSFVSCTRRVYMKTIGNLQFWCGAPAGPVTIVVFVIHLQHSTAY